jgi:hypothetical protein
MLDYKSMIRGSFKPFCLSVSDRRFALLALPLRR